MNNFSKPKIIFLQTFICTLAAIAIGMSVFCDEVTWGVELAHPGFEIFVGCKLTILFDFSVIVASCSIFKEGLGDKKLVDFFHYISGDARLNLDLGIDFREP